MSTSLNAYRQQLAMFQKDNKNTLSSIIVEEEIMLVLKEVSQKQKNNTLTFLNGFVSNILSKIYDKEQTFTIRLDEQKSTVKVKFYVTEDNIEIEVKRPFVGKGGGKLSVMSLALKLALMQVKGIKGSIFLDEATKMVDNSALKSLNTFLEEYARETNNQIFLISHQETPAEVTQLKLKKIGGETSYEV